jgi:hypothetical protein
MLIIKVLDSKLSHNHIYTELGRINASVAIDPVLGAYVALDFTYKITLNLHEVLRYPTILEPDMHRVCRIMVAKYYPNGQNLQQAAES